jgi:hypothetical protein
MQSWLVAFAFLAAGLKALGVIPSWKAALAFWALGAVVAVAEMVWRTQREKWTFEALRARRRRVRADLARARALLPPAGEGTVRGHLALFDKWMLSGELESAFDELEAAGSALACPPDYWLALRDAAQRLGLAEESARIGERLGDQA